MLQGITPKKLYSFYQNFLENSMKDVYIIGISLLVYLGSKKSKMKLEMIIPPTLVLDA